ncbi:MAG: hypothetical protein LBR14_03645 [Clostridiales Family XIII bacterium]|jgi:cytochrome b subunit of formate dehydrogenase|nr:hypothetical protein [Clostridiales Family XIII bacterium]
MGDVKRKNLTTTAVAVLGISTAIVFVLLYLGSIVPGIDLTLMGIAGAVLYVTASRMGIGSGLLLFAASGILAVLIVPGKILLIPYLTCLGPYGVGKALLDWIFTSFGRRKDAQEEGEAETPVALRAQRNWQRKLYGLGISGSPGRVLLSYLCRLVIFASLAVTSWLIFKEAFFDPADLPDAALPFIIPGFLVIFLLYDYILGCLAFIAQRVLRKL